MPRNRGFSGAGPIWYQATLLCDGWKNGSGCLAGESLAGGRSVDTSPDPAGHVGFYIRICAEPPTLYKGVQALPSGSSLWKIGNMLETRKYFDVCSHLISRSTEVSAADVLRKLHTALSECRPPSGRRRACWSVFIGWFGLGDRYRFGTERTNAALEL